MLDRLPKGWWFTTGLAALAIVGAMLARSASPPTAEPTYETEADPCFRYGRLECCVRESDSL